MEKGGLEPPLPVCKTSPLPVKEFPQIKYITAPEKDYSPKLNILPPLRRTISLWRPFLETYILFLLILPGKLILLILSFNLFPRSLSSRSMIKTS
jgi:hypothetical protein